MPRPAGPDLTGHDATVSADIASLAQAAASGNHEAFRLLYERFGRAVHAVVAERLPHDVAEDLVQDVFIQAYARLRDLRDPAAFGSWVCAIARSLAADHYRRRGPTAAPVPDTMVSPDKPDVLADARRVLAIIQTLPETYRETLVLRLLDGYSGPEIAALTGMSHGSVRVNLHRGFRLLRDKLGVTS